MSEKEKKIMETFGRVIPTLTDSEKNQLLAFGEGMDRRPPGPGRGLREGQQKNKGGR